MTTSAPPREVLAAFGVAGEAVPLAGGFSGSAWRVGDVVLKPVGDEEEHAWVCEVYDAWSCPDVSVTQPVRSRGGGWSVGRWGAQSVLPGSTARAGDDPDWFRRVHTAFHTAVAGLARPTFLDRRDDPWTIGDRVAWDELEPEGTPETVAFVERAMALFAPVEDPDQVVHGDLTGNVLRDGDRAAVIDWPPYWRPAGWALAVVGVDVVCWEGADPTLLDRWSTGPAWPQLLLRALVFRTASRGRHEMLGHVPPPDAQYLAVKDRLLDLVEDRL